MNPYQNALRKKKFEGLTVEITPIGEASQREEMEQMAANGDAAPEVLDDNQPEPQMAQLGHMESEELTEDLPISDQAAKEFTQKAEATPGLKEEDVFGTSLDFKGPPKSLREKARVNMRKK